jgi:hypothetical protein
VFGWFATKDVLFHFGESELVVGSLLKLWLVGLHCLVECAIIKCDSVFVPQDLGNSFTASLLNDHVSGRRRRRLLC